MVVDRDFPNQYSQEHFLEANLYLMPENYSFSDLNDE
jgi:hypothetical protein